MINTFEQYWIKFFESPLFNTVVVLIVAGILYAIIHKVMRASEKSKRAESMSRRGKTYMKLINSVIKTAFLALTALIVLQVNGVNITSILAGVGIMSVVIGLAIQDTFKDVVRGLTMIIDGYFAVGDVIKLEDGTEARVTSVGIRTTRLKGITDGCTISMSNRNIDKVKILPNTVAITVSLPYETTMKETDRIISDICTKIESFEEAEAVTYRGVKELASSSVDHLIVIATAAENRGTLKRAANRVILDSLESHKISVPYQQIDIHNK